MLFVALLRSNQQPRAMMMTPLFASIQFGRNRSPLQEKSIIARMFENTLRCTGRSLFMQLPIFPLLTAVRRRANEYCALTLNIFFSPDLERVTFFQHLAQINDRVVCSNPIGNFVLVTELSKNYIQSVPAKSGQFQTNNAIVDIFSPTLSHPKRRSDILYPTGTSSQ